MTTKLFNILFLISLFFFTACSNSEYIDGAQTDNYCAVEEDSVSPTYDNQTSDNSIKSPQDNDDCITQQEQTYIPLNDSEYPYAGIPRIVIETANYQKIKDRETEVPAKAQFWGKDSPSSDIMELTIRGRGNTSWFSPKKAYKIEFSQKQQLLGMPANRDWALIPNYADKTLMKNYLMYHLSAKLGAYYSPRCEFAELYLNGDYLGIYLLTETIKIAKKRINIPENSESYVVEFDGKLREDEQAVYSSVINPTGKNFRIHDPKNASNEVLSTIDEYIHSFETFLIDIKKDQDNNLNQWIDIDECVKHYWVQEFSKNPDAIFFTSVFFSWTKGGLIKMGPVWDFDLSFGSHNNESINTTENWYLKISYWNIYIFRDSVAKQARIDFWKEHRDQFVKTLDDADSICTLLQNAAKNNFKRWNILSRTEYAYHRHAYDSYEEAVEDLKNWIRARIKWIDENI